MLLDLLEKIVDVFNIGCVCDVIVVNELVMVFKKCLEEVEVWFDDDIQEIMCGMVKLLCEFLDEKGCDFNIVDVFNGQIDVECDVEVGDGQDGEDGDQDGKDVKEKGVKELDLDKLKKVIVQVEYDECFVCFIFNCWLLVEGYVWLKYEDDGQEFEVNFVDVKLVVFIEG